MIKSELLNIDDNSIVAFDFSSINENDFIVPVFFDDYQFHELHQVFVDNVVCLVVAAKKKVVGFCYIGNSDQSIYIPYSSPFSLIYLKNDFSIKDASLFVLGLIKYAEKKSVKAINIKFPPEIYKFELTNILSSILLYYGFSIKYFDLNNYFNLLSFINLDSYFENCNAKVRKNYRRAKKNGMYLKVLDKREFCVAYHVIQQNRKQMGYPLKITESQMKLLISIAKDRIKFFVVRTLNNIDIASAIVFDVTDKISQVVYWGDLLEYRKDRSMDFLALELFNYYFSLGKECLDIGPSSETGILNVGLLEFKRSLGCQSCLKHSFVYSVE